MKKIFIKYKNIVYSFVGILLILFLWLIISEIIGEKKLIFPGPIDTFEYFFKLITYKSTYISIGYSLYKMILGYFVSIILALILGTLAGLYDCIYIIFKPLITTLKAIPTATILFLFLVLAGFDNSPIYVVILVSFPILYESFAGGIKNIPSTLNDAISLDGGNNIINILKVKLPLAFKYIIIGITSSFALSFKIEIMAEVLAGNTVYGIGTNISAIQTAGSNMTGIFAWTLIALIILLLISLISNLIKKIFINKIN